MFKLISFLFLAVIKILSHIFYKSKINWLSKEKFEAVPEVNLMIFLNHTSLFEPLFIRFAPWSLAWRLSQDLVVPGADITLRRPMAGSLLKALMPGVVPITRKNDHSWLHFLSYVQEDKLNAILPEGRMKRRDGMDKFGKPMSVRGGVADILNCLNSGKILFVYSGGLHHIQAPGDKWPRLFKTLEANLEIVKVEEYKKSLGLEDNEDVMASNEYKYAVMADMNRRLVECVPPPQ